MSQSGIDEILVFPWQGAEAVQVAAQRRADKELAEAMLPVEGSGAGREALQPRKDDEGDTDMLGEERAASGQKASISGRAAVPGTPSPSNFRNICCYHTKTHIHGHLLPYCAKPGERY